MRGGLQPKIPWDPIKDFAPVSLVPNFEWAQVATPSLPYRTAANVIAAAKAQPGVTNHQRHRQTAAHCHGAGRRRQPSRHGAYPNYHGIGQCDGRNA
jgi:tripartite-type tricarboxylate transporter receptor subunit TctC